MKKCFALSSQIALLIGATSVSAISVASCTVEVWRSNIQMVVSPGGSKLADHSFIQGSYQGIINFLKEVYSQDGRKLIEPKPENNIDKLGGIWRQPAGLDSMKFIEAYRDAYTSRARTLVCTGFEQKGPLEDFTSYKKEVFGKFPPWVRHVRDQIGIVYVDGSLDPKKCNPYNISTVAYAVDEAGVMAGILTGIMLNIDDYYTPAKNVDFNGPNYFGIQTAKLDENGKPDVKDYGDYKIVQTKGVEALDKQAGWYKGDVFKIGTYFGIPIDSTLPFFNGWAQGARFFNEHMAEVKAIAAEKIKGMDSSKKWLPLTVVGPDSDSCTELFMGNFTPNSFSPVESKAKTIVNKYMDRGIAALLPVAGPQDPMVVNEIVQHKKHIAVIGADVALEDDNSVNQYVKDASLKGTRSVIPFSIMKNLTNSVYSILNAVNQSMVSGDVHKSKNGYYGFGHNNFGILENEGVKVSHGKIYYNNKNSQEKSYDDKVCIQLVEAFQKKMNDDDGWKAEVKIGGQTKKVPFYASLNGFEIEQTWVSKYEGKSIISVPRIANKINDKANIQAPSNYYAPLPRKAQLIANEDMVKKFVKDLYKSINTFSEHGEKKPELKSGESVKWYMYR